MSMSPQPPPDPATPVPVSAAQRALITQALSQTRALTRYHFTVSTLEGPILRPSARGGGLRRRSRGFSR